MDYFNYIKASHIIFVVTWFSGIFYLCRLFIYNEEANNKDINERNILQQQFNIMSRKLLYAIVWPSSIIAILTGFILTNKYLIEFPTWLILKLVFVVVLVLYQMSLQLIYSQQSKNIYKYKSQTLRYWNEVPTLLLVCIVFLVVVNSIKATFLALGFIFVLIIFIFAILKYINNK